MPFLLLGFAALVILVLVSRAFARMKTVEAARWSRITLGLAAALFGGLLTLRGLAVIGAPLATFGVGLMAVGAGFRPKPGRGPNAGNGSVATRMSREDALDVLGLDANPTDEDIRAAYRTLMKKVHPDAGGTDGLSRRLTEARDLLLKD
jgi:DnaJ domain